MNVLLGANSDSRTNRWSAPPKVVHFGNKAFPLPTVDELRDCLLNRENTYDWFSRMADGPRRQVVGDPEVLKSLLQQNEDQHMRRVDRHRLLEKIVKVSEEEYQFELAAKYQGLLEELRKTLPNPLHC